MLSADRYLNERLNMNLKKLIPMLNVSNISESLAFYKSALRFDIVSDPAAVAEWKWATIRSGNTELMLSESHGELALEKGIDPHISTNWPTIFYFYPDSLDELHRHILQCGYKPTDIVETVYGMKEFSIQDPDGHMLSFGEDASQ